MLYFSRWKSILIWLIIVASVLVALPNLFGRDQLASLPKWFPAKKITLGLDLQGGSHIMLKVERADIIRQRLEATVGDIRTRLRDANIAYTGLSGVAQAIQVRINDLSQIDTAKAALKTLSDPVKTGTLTGGSIQEVLIEDGQDGLLKLSVTDQSITYRLSNALIQSMEVIRRRVDELGSTEPRIQRQGADRIIVQVPGLDDPQRLKALLNQTGELGFRMVDTSMPVEQAMNGQPPANSEVLYTSDDPTIPYLVEKHAVVSGQDLIDAQASFNQKANQSVVSFHFGSEATQRFAKATTENVGKRFAIVLDGQVVSAPVIREPITGGAGQISGNFSVEGANDLAILLRAGALPATLTVVEERTVGPSLGADSIRAGFVSAVIGALLVIAFMVGFYGVLGVIATVALTINVIMMIALLTLLGSTLTLPGIAGIVLTIGMAVDSNVLIYERIREEWKGGRPIAEAMATGFSKALTTIIDSNLTTLIAALVLFYMGSGSVRGFAVALAVGILTTVFTAFTVTRWIVSGWLARSRVKSLPKGVRTGIFDDTNIRFMGIRRYTFAASAALAIAAMIGFMTVGLNLGVDFKGGSIIELKARQGNADTADIRARLSELNLGEAQVQSFGGASTVLVRIPSQDGGENAEQSAISLVRGEFESTYDFRRVEVVGPSVSGELTMMATLGIAASLGAILLYIWFRFEWQFAVGAIIATLHDVILTLGLFVVTGFEFNIISIAAILTLVGYSLNDTVVVYDRMRENLRRFPKMPLSVLIDASINQTLSRTVLTSAVTMLALLALYIFGGEVMRSFTFAMLFGVAIGTFSSIYMAAPILIVFRLRPETVGTDEDNAPAVKHHNAGASL